MFVDTKIVPSRYFNSSVQAFEMQKKGNDGMCNLCKNIKDKLKQLSESHAVGDKTKRKRETKMYSLEISENGMKFVHVCVCVRALAHSTET